VNPDVLARRSNKSATKFGAIVEAGHPPEAKQAYSLDASAAGNELDVLASFNIGTSTDAVTSYRRLQPEQTEVRFTVLDAGEAVSGARVTVAGRAGTTDAKGRVSLTLRSNGTVRARATRSGYTAALESLDLRR